jgi:hypothetical protein
MKDFHKEDNPENSQAAWVIHKEEASIIPSDETNSVVA